MTPPGRRKKLILLAAILGSAVAWLDATAVNVPVVVVTVLIIFAAVPPSAGRRGVRVDWLGALLCTAGLAGPVLALIRQPLLGWGSPGVLVPGLAGIAVFALFLYHEHVTPA